MTLVSRRGLCSWRLMVFEKGKTMVISCFLGIVDGLFTHNAESRGKQVASVKIADHSSKTSENRIKIDVKSYVDEVIDKMKKYDYVLVTYTKRVRNEMWRRGIPYVMAYPCDTHPSIPLTAYIISTAGMGDCEDPEYVFGERDDEELSRKPDVPGKTAPIIKYLRASLSSIRTEYHDAKIELGANQYLSDVIFK